MGKKQELENKLKELGIDNHRVGTVSFSSSTVDVDDLGNKEVASESISYKPIAKPQWGFVQRAHKTVIKPTKAKAVKRDYKIAVFLPDPQIGYRYFGNEDWVPFHDERAINLALQIINQIQPDKIINLGDFLDLPELSRWQQEEAFQRTTQKAIDYGHDLLCKQRASAPNAEIVLLEGNHERRLKNYIINNANKIYGLTRANTPEDWQQYDIPYFLRLSDLDITYVDGYPAGEYYVNDTLKVKHGDVVRTAGRTAAAVAEREQISTIFGHIHRIETAYKTFHTRDGKKQIFAHSPGSLCRTDGAVPGHGTSTDRSGRHITHWQNWQQGIAVVKYDDNGNNFLQDIPFIDYTAIYDGKTFTESD